MKFDLIISNPPFTFGAHLKILEKIWHSTEELCFIHPINWLYDNKMKAKLFNRCREMVKAHFIHWEDIKDANKLFSIAAFTAIGITYYNKKETGIGDAIYDIDIHGDSEIYKSIKRKILNYCKEKNNLINMVYYTGQKNKKL